MHRHMYRHTQRHKHTDTHRETPIHVNTDTRETHTDVHTQRLGQVTDMNSIFGKTQGPGWVGVVVGFSAGNQNLPKYSYLGPCAADSAFAPSSLPCALFCPALCPRGLTLGTSPLGLLVQLGLWLWEGCHGRLRGKTLK